MARNVNRTHGESLQKGVGMDAPATSARGTKAKYRIDAFHELENKRNNL